MSSASSQSAVYYQRSRTGCTNCRLRHLKCDDAQPTCTRCAKRGVSCVRGFNVRFKHYSNIISTTSKSYQYNFPSDQKWCTSGKTLSFVDESPTLLSTYESKSDSELEDDTTSSRTAQGLEQLSINALTTSNADSQDQRNTSETLYLNQFSYSPVSRQDDYGWPTHRDDQLAKTSPELPSGASVTTDPKPSLYQDVSMWPLKNPTEARLIRYFIEHVSRRFDLCDADKHFASVVPCRAAHCPPLMDAAFALSARYLSRTTDFDEYVADEYYQRCLNSLVPTLSDADALLNQDLFAAIVILRTLEEIEVPLSGADSRTHLVGNHLFVSAYTGRSPGSEADGPCRLHELTGLRRASFLVAFRQELYTAFVTQRPVMPEFYLHDVDRSVVNPADDCTWTNRILLHVADALDFCFNDRALAADAALKRHEDLVSYGTQWYANKPSSFSPLFIGSDGNGDKAGRTDSRSISPDIWLLSDAVATGLLNYHLSCILLLAFDPRTPRLGPSRTQFLKRQNEQIKEEVRTLIGMANGNVGCAPHFVLACMGVALAGDRFEERWEQEELLQFLLKTETVYAWSTSTAQHHLVEAWGWGETNT